MKKRIMVTSLKNRKYNGELNYYYINDGSRNMYCDALSSTEAGCKYILSNYDIDLILTFGSESTYDPGDDVKNMLLEEGKSFYMSDNSQMSSYSLLRYRLAEYLDDINSEVQDIRDSLTERQTNVAEGFIKDFMNNNVPANGKSRKNKYFNSLVEDEELRDKFEEEMNKTAKKAKIDLDKFKNFVLLYLYREYIEYGKMHLLDSNEDVRIRFLSSGENDDNGISFANLLIEQMTQLNEITEDDEVDEVELFLCIQDDNAKDTFVLTSLMEMIKSLPNSKLTVSKIIMAESYTNIVASRISDDTDKFLISELISGTKAFLKYGKTDMLIDFRDNMNVQNPEIDRILYSMKNIDTGISLCDITDIERGISNLRMYFSDNMKINGNSFAEKCFNVVLGGLKQDFGPLLSGDRLEFIDLVKWAYKKGFWQQTLTLIESRAPRDFVNKGIYYYCNSEENREEVIKKLGQIYYNFKLHEKYKLDDVSHYYVKFYGRGRVIRKDDAKSYQLDYAKLRVKELENKSEEIITAHTLCKDINALRDLLFSYYNIGDVRNATNHAADEFSGFVSIMEASDISERMNLISHSVNYFIYCYDKVLGLLEKTAEKSVYTIETSDIVEYTNTLRKIDRDKRNNEKDSDKENFSAQNKKPGQNNQNSNNKRPYRPKKDNNNKHKDNKNK